MIYVYTDGSCKPSNPGFGGSGYIILVDGQEVKSEGRYLGESTNNIAELSAILFALESLKDGNLHTQKITVFTDSQYSIGILTKGWNAKKNVELIADIKNMLCNFSDISFQWVKGHVGDKYNEMVDRLANSAIDSQCE